MLRQTYSSLSVFLTTIVLSEFSRAKANKHFFKKLKVVLEVLQSYNRVISEIN